MALIGYNFVGPSLLVFDALPIMGTHVPCNGTEDGHSRNLWRGGRRLAVKLQHGTTRHCHRPGNGRGVMALIGYNFIMPPLLVIDALPVMGTYAPQHGTELARGRNV